MVRRLADPGNRFMAVVGASGSGKSSLVAAGLLSRLQDNVAAGWGGWSWVRFTPGGAGGNPFRALAEALAAQSQDRRADDLEMRLSARFEALAALAAESLKHQPDAAEWLLFIDQFEELFTLVDERRHGSFIRWLASAARTPRVRVVATLRADFYAHCVGWPELAELLRSGSYPLAAPGLGALYEMITGPAERAGLSFEEGLVAQLLEDTGMEPGALALLAFALAELYEGRTGDGRLTWAVYDGFKGVQGAIAQRAEGIFNTLDGDEATLEDVFRALVEVDERGTATRRRAPVRQAVRSDAAGALVNALTAGRLLVQSRGENGQAVVEVAHEALLRSWQKLAAWIEKASDDLRLLRQVRLAAGEWDENGRKNAFLWPDERLKPVAEMVGRLAPELSGVEQAFLRPEIERLLEELDDPATPHQRRAAVGERMFLIGDTRPGVGLGQDGLPEIVWCEVPADEVSLEDEAGTYAVESFSIARYPVAYRQYRSLLDAEGGYRNRRWWDGLAERQDEPGEQRWKVDNHPAENVSWYDAMAFCRWLTERLGEEFRKHFGADQIIRLPAKWEWQQAATGGNPSNEFPWGPDWDSRRANTYESGLSRATAVGMYPQGASSAGALDMSGNVREWCLNEYENPGQTGPAGSAHRVVRGGSCNNNQDKGARRVPQPQQPRQPERQPGFSGVVFVPHRSTDH